MRRVLAVIFIFSVIFISSCDNNKTSLDNNILGFWELDDSAGQNDILRFCEITDSVFGIWTEDAGYLPATRYKVEKLDSLFFYKQGKILDSKGRIKSYIGKIKFTNDDLFIVVSDSKILTFAKSNKLIFKELNLHHEKWLDW